MAEVEAEVVLERYGGNGEIINQQVLVAGEISSVLSKLPEGTFIGESSQAAFLMPEGGGVLQVTGNNITVRQ